MDRAYLEFERLYPLPKLAASLSRARRNLKHERRYSDRADWRAAWAAIRT